MLIEQQQTKPNPIKTDSALNCFIGNLDFDRAQWSQLIQLCASVVLMHANAQV